MRPTAALTWLKLVAAHPAGAALASQLIPEKITRKWVSVKRGPAHRRQPARCNLVATALALTTTPPATNRYLPVSKILGLYRPVAHPRTDTRKQILDLAAALLQDRGFSAFSYHDISQQLGIRNAAVHYHFPTKCDLGIAVIQRYRHRFQRYIEMLDQGGADPMLKLEAYFTIPWGYLRDGGKVCPLGMLETEFYAIPEAMRVEARSLDQEIRQWLTQALREGRDQRLFRFQGSAKDKALLMVATLQGALQISRVVGRDGFSACVRQLKWDLGLVSS